MGNPKYSGTADPGNTTKIEASGIIFSGQVVKVLKRTETAKLPEYKTEGAFAADLYADENVSIPQEHTVLVDTGLSVEVPEGHVMLINIRSGLSTKGIMLANGTGIIDSDYRGPVKCIIHNGSEFPYNISNGDRIAQCYIIRKVDVMFTETSELSDTERGEGGFGSTGK